MPSAIRHLTARLRAARNQCLDLLDRLPEDRLADTPPNFDKNAAWLIGHLGAADALGARLLGLAPASGTEGSGATVMQAFGPGSAGTVDLATFRSAFGSRDGARERLREGHERMLSAVESLPDGALDQSIEDARVRAFFPDIGTFLTYMIWHEGWHAGQLSQWARALGLRVAE